MIGPFRGKYRFLSNFWTSIVTFEGVPYPSVEHAYQAAKTLDLEWRRRICHCSKPGEAKILGSKLPFRSDWEAIKLSVMEDLVRQKFQDPNLKRWLVEETGDEDLVEVNTWGDKFWGAVWEDVFPPESTKDFQRLVGENHLGKILMKIREELK